jgi:thiol-disulfide isomerase/thioredoxin
LRLFLLLLPVFAQAFDVRDPFTARAYDPREPGKGDFLDCPAATGPCETVLIPRVEPDEKVALPRNKPREDLSFLVLKGFRAQGGDPVTTGAVYRTAAGESVFVDWNNDEDLGNDGPARFWSKSDSCVTVDGGAGRAATISLCRAGSKAKEWNKRCEGLKEQITWAHCEEGPYRVRFHDIAWGTLGSGAKPRKIGVCDIDGDGKYKLQGGDRLLVDWNADGILEKSLEGDGFAALSDGSPFVFSLDGATYELGPADEDGSGLSLTRIYPFRPGTELFKAVEGKPAPDFRFVNMDGDTVKLSDYRGAKVLLQFWSTLCMPCLEQFPQLHKFKDQFKAKNWEVISVTTEKELERVQQATLKHKLDWNVGMAGPEVRGYYGSQPLPMLFKIDAKGVIEKKGFPLGNRAF